MINGATTISMPFDVCERFVDRIIELIPNTTRAKAKEYVASVDEIVAIAGTKVEELVKKEVKENVSELEKKLETRIKLEIRESDIATGKDILALDNKIEQNITALDSKIERNILILDNKIGLLDNKITILMWMLGVIIAIVGVIATFMSLKM